MNRILAIGALVLTLTGCAQVTAFRDFLVDAKTQQAAQVFVSTARAGAQLAACFVGAGSAIALSVEKQSGSQGQYTTGIVYASASAVCVALGGTVSGTVTAQGGETVVTGTK